MNYVEIYKAVLDFHRKYSKVQDTDEYWAGVINGSNKIARQYNNTKFVIDLLVAVIKELERKSKQIQKVTPEKEAAEK